LQVSDEALSSIFSSILGWHLSSQPFPAAARSLADPIIAATLQLYSAAATQLLPTPAKSHYTFNLRDFARVIQVCPSMRWRLILCAAWPQNTRDMPAGAHQHQLKAVGQGAVLCATED
jgi:hypothetical protein